MEKRLSYIVVGAFVVVLSLSLFGFLFWMVKYDQNENEFKYYKTYFQESVSGLNVESFVKLKGVEVGRVRKISIDKDDPSKVEVLLEIKKGVPIKTDTYSMLDTQGITGLKYVELKGGSKNSKFLKTSSEHIAVIPSKKSVLSALFESSESITSKIDTLLDRVKLMLSKKNIDNLAKITQNLANTTTYLDSNKERFLEVTEEIKKMREDINRALVSMTKDVTRFTDNSIKFLDDTKEFEDKLVPSFDKLGVMSDKAGAASDATKELFENLDKKLNSKEFDIAGIVEKNMQILNESAFVIKDLSVRIEELVEELKESPSDILYKSRRKILGPGESNE